LLDIAAGSVALPSQRPLAFRPWARTADRRNASAPPPVQRLRRTAELERATGADELDREGLALMARWRVDIIRKRAEHLGTVEAANEKEAIDKAAKEFDIPPGRQNRITVEKMNKSKD
jgi:hypothetical protein